MIFYENDNQKQLNIFLINLLTRQAVIIVLIINIKIINI